MRIACPTCEAAYDVPPERLAPGKGVRCARCGVVWQPVAREDAAPPIPLQQDPPITPPIPDIVPEAAAAAPSAPLIPPEPEPASTLPAASPAPAPTVQTTPATHARAPVALAWLASLVLLAGTGYALVTHRAAVMHAWPPSIRAYAALGLAGQ